MEPNPLPIEVVGKNLFDLGRLCKNSSLGFITKATYKIHSRHENYVEIRSWQICLHLLRQNKWIIFKNSGF